MRPIGVALVVLLLGLLVVAPAVASDWLPHPAGGTWTYLYSDSAYSTAPQTEHVTVVKTSGGGFKLGWTVEGAPNKTGCPDGENLTGWVAFQESSAGLMNGADGWCGAAQPAEFPVLCASADNCGNSLSSTLYMLIWGSRAPILGEPLLRGSSWTSSGGSQSDVKSINEYLGLERVTVPAFPESVLAAKVQSQVTQAGALGDPFGSGIRTVWWVYGVGPVKIVFQHAGGTSAPVTTAVLKESNQTPQPAPIDLAYFPRNAGAKGTYRWTNARYLKQPEIQKFSINQAANGTVIAKLEYVSGPIKMAGAYQFTTRMDGVISVASAVKAASIAKLPPLGPSFLPVNKRRHFFTPFDLMTFGFNPLLPGNPTAGTSWSSVPNSRDFTVYGVTGTSRVVGVQRITVAKGTYEALVVVSTLKQPGFPFGSGTRTMWFAPDVGLVKLRFAHADGSVSLVELIS